MAYPLQKVEEFVHKKMVPPSFFQLKKKGE
jgi:hypothetical protein